MALVVLRRRGAPIALVAFTTFLANTLRTPLARADQPEHVEIARQAPPADSAARAESAEPVLPQSVTVPSAGDASTAKAGAEKASPPASRLGEGGVGRAVPASLPVNGNDKTGVSSQAIALPQGTGKIQGMGESFSTQLSTGVATFTVPFAILPARGGAQPSLSLTYSSASGHGVAGVGWDAGVPFISRQTDRGIPQYQDPQGAWQPTQDRFIFNGGEELVPICLVQGTTCANALSGEVMPAWGSGWQYFRPRVEGGFLRFFWSPDHRTWRVQSKSGTSMELGAPLDGSGYTGALETDPTGSHIFRWDLVREYDAYGGANPSGSTLPTPVNIVAYRYQQSGGMAYLSDIYDTPPAANPSSAPVSAYAHHARLVYETRTDPTISFTRGWQTTQALRLSGVDVTSQTFGGSAAREMVRRYHLAYDGNYHVSLLASVQMEGRCNTTEDGPGAVSEDSTGSLPATACPTLPAMTFGYSHVQGYDIGGNPQTSDLPGYEPFDERVTDFANSPPNSIDEDVTDLFDVNADGLPDVLVTNPAQFNGNLGVYFNGTGGQANTFSGPYQMPVTGVPNEDANTINLLNANVSAADIDGDGVIDLIHMPQVQTYSVYTPVGSGTSYSWVGRAITTASQQSPKIDFGDDSQNILVADVNNDGLVDVMYSSGTSLQTFFSLGRYPNGDGQFGSAQWTGPTSSQISNDPIQYCLPYSGLPVQFEDSNTKLADMNGDGLQDIVYVQQGNIVYWPGRGNGYFGTGDPSACPAGTFGQNTSVAMAQSPWYSDPNGSTVRLDDVNGDGLDDLVQIGFNFVEIWLNVDGTGFTGEHLISGSPAAPSYANRVRLVDANGSGTRDVLWGDATAYKYIDLQGAVRPWTLTHVQNGLGKTTDIQYASSTQLMLAAAGAGSPWTSVIPNPVHVVTQVTEKDNLGAVGRAGGVYISEYDYSAPVYDGRQREFRGFESAISTRLGDANSPTAVTSSLFLLGQCKNDEQTSPNPCYDDGRWEANPREALKGLPSLSETHDLAGVYQSSIHHTYRLRRLYVGLDGREVRIAFESQSDTFAYDNAPFTPATQTIVLPDVELETTLGDVSPDTSASMPLRAIVGRAHLHTHAESDPFGNQNIDEDDGCVDGCTISDDAITTTTVSGLAFSSEPSGWMYRFLESYVTSVQFPERRKDILTTYDQGGKQTLRQAVLQGTMPLARFYGDGTVPPNGVAPTPPPGASQDGTVAVMAWKFDAFGNSILQTAPNARCRQFLYDPAYAELPVTEIVYVGGPASTTIDQTPVTCGGIALSTIAYQDRSLGVVTKVVDLHGEVTTAQYDGFSRLTVLQEPDPAAVGSVSSVPSVTVDYQLPTDPTATPYSIVHMRAQDGATSNDPSYRESWAFLDGFARTIVKLDEADPGAGDGGQWVVQGPTDYDAKSAPKRAYLPWFWNGTPLQFPLSTVPPSQYTSQRYDAFGRALQTYTLDGIVGLQRAYHALSTDQWDAADLLPGPHQGTPATTINDGHGRPISVIERIHSGNAIENHATTTVYLSTGEPQTITRSTTSSSSVVSRWIMYDSLGRMVLNVEPDTAKNFTATPALAPSGVPANLRAWAYAYDDNGDLVGTSDARGCGVNYTYDAGGRIVAEDFSPCSASQQPYSSPQANGDGTEALYQYDTPDGDTQSVQVAGGGQTAACVDPSLTLGRLVAISDRGAKTAQGYDGRGRVSCMARRIAGPTPSNTLSSRYSGWFARSFVFDGADRPIKESTGADVPELLGGQGESYATIEYSARGTVRAVGSSYGQVVASVARSADGHVSQVVYGDTAVTTSAFSYDTRRRLSSVQTYRGPPAIWSQPPTSYLPAPDPGGAPTTFQLLLQDTDYTYDVVDNPVAITDFRNPAEWPSGAQPVSRKAQYDDLYRIANITYSYPGGTDAWVDPFSADDTGAASDPRRGTPSPHVAFANRVTSQAIQFDWLGNTVRTDDDARGFYDRSLGAIANGGVQGPYQLRSATGSTSLADGTLTVAYDDSGNVTSLSVLRYGNCLPAGAQCSERFAYDWDEAGRLVHARRWDTASPGAASDPLPSATPSAELTYAYDVEDDRTLKTAVGVNSTLMSTAYVFGSLELRGTIWSGSDFARTNTTEVPFILAHGVRLARVHYSLEDEPSLTSGTLHLLLELDDHLGSTSVVIDRDTSEVVEATTYAAFGGADSDYRPQRWASFREDYQFTGKEDDVELGLAYYGKRYLSPALGRWLSPDPLAVHALGADANVYGYVHGSILKATDPTGLAEPAPVLPDPSPVPSPVVGPDESGVFLRAGGTSTAAGGAATAAGEEGGFALGPVAGLVTTAVGPVVVYLFTDVQPGPTHPVTPAAAVSRPLPPPPVSKPVASPKPAWAAVPNDCIPRPPLTPEQQAIYDRVRPQTPTPELRRGVNGDEPMSRKKVGMKTDPVFKYTTDSFEADHIVPLKEIVQMPGFDKLTEAQQVEVANLKENIMGLGKSTNASKGAKNWCEYQGHRYYGPVPPDVKKAMLERDAQARQALQDAIDQRIQLNEAAAAQQKAQGGGATSSGQGSQQ